MKHILTILFFLPLLAGAQAHHVVRVGQGEYTRLEILDNGQGGTLTNDVSLMGNTAGGQQGVFNPIGTATPMGFCIANLHSGAFIDNSGNVWFMGQPDGNPYITGSGIYEASTDSAGNTITGGFSTLATGWQAADGAYAWFYGIRNSDSSLMGCGDLQHGMRGIHGAAGSLTSKWVATPLPVGEKAKSIMGSVNLFVLCWSGHVYALTNANSYQADAGWGTSPGFAAAGSYSSTYDQPNELMVSGVPLAHIRMIAGGMDCNWAIDSSHNMYAWTVNGWRVGHSLSVGTDIMANPTLMNSYLSSYFNPALVDTIVTDGACQHVLLSPGTIWGWGSNEQGTVGNGQSLNFAFTSTPYYDGGGDENSGAFVQFTPVQVAPGKSDFVTLNNGIYYNYYNVAFDAKGRKIVWSRDKAIAMSMKTKPIDSVLGHTQEDYPDSWNRPDPTYEFNEDTVTQVWASTSPGCYNACVAGPTTGSPCSVNPPTCYTDHAHLSLTSSGLTIYASATASTSTGFLSYVVFTVPSGAGTANRGVADNPVTQTDTILVSAPGSYTVMVKVQDPSWGADSATATITVYGQTGFYFAAAGSDANATNSISTPWQTNTKFNAIQSSLGPGDTVYFNRGDAFPGIWRLTASGVVIMYYGSGPDPVFGGMTTLTFTGSGPNYTATCSGCTANTNLFTMDGNIQVLGQTPNAPYQWYTFIPGSSSTTTLYDPTDLATAPAISRVGVFSSTFTQDNSTVTAQTTSLLTFSPAVSYVGVGGTAWFRYSTPDTLGEWSYSGGAGGTITANGMSGHSGAAAGADTVWYITGSNDKLMGVAVHGANKVLIIANGYADSLVSDSLAYSGQDGISGSGNRLYISNPWIKNIQNTAIYQTPAGGHEDTGWTILYPVIRNVGLWRGMGQNGSGQMEGISAPGYATVISHLIADSLGFNGIYTGGDDSIHIHAPSITHFNLRLTDGAAVYAWRNTVGTWTYGRDADSIYAADGGNVNAFLGTTNNSTNASWAFYADSHSNGWGVSNVVSINNLSGGVINHGPGNTYNNLLIVCMGNGGHGFLNAEVSGGPVITSVSLSGATIYGSGADVLVENTTIGSDILTMLSSNGNHFYHSTSSTPFFTKSSSDGGTARTLPSWTTNTGQDGSSAFQALTLYAFGNPAFSTQILALPGTYTDVTGHLYYFNHLSLSPLSATLLQLKNPGTWWRFKKHP